MAACRPGRGHRACRNRSTLNRGSIPTDDGGLRPLGVSSPPPRSSQATLEVHGMDGERFDTLTRSLHDARFDCLAPAVATCSSRRDVLGMLLGTALSGLFGLLETTARGRRRRNCPLGRSRCDGKCCKAVESICRRGRCIHHCEDDTTDFGETNVDCGGTCRNVRKCDRLRSCVIDADCLSDICFERSPGRRVCGDCRIDSDCDTTPLNLGSRCIDNICRECVLHSDCEACCPERPFCVPFVPFPCSNNQPCVCRECRQDTDCPEGSFCDSGDCEGSECASDNDCASQPDRRTLCVAGQCVQCRSDNDCEAEDVCVNGFCSDCRDGADCPAERPVCDQNHDCIAA